MTVRLTGGNQVVVGGLAELAEAQAELSESMTKELRKEAPIDTGALRSSIRRGRGKVLTLFTELHGVVIDAKGKHRGWIDRALRRGITAFERGG